MNKTHYYCDICKKEFEKEELVRVHIELQYHKGWKNHNNNYDLCDRCAEKLGFKKAKVAEAQIVEPTTAEQLYEIVVQIVHEQG